MMLKNAKIMKDGKPIPVNILIKGSKIEKVSLRPIKGGESIDMQNQLVLPGLIDSHVHMRDPGGTHKEDYLSGSCAAAAGGVTTFLDMPNNNPSTTTLAALEEKRELAAKSLVNYGFHFGATTKNLEQIKKAKNIASVKLYMGSTTGDLLVDAEGTLQELFEKVKTLFTVHAEDESMIRENASRYRDCNYAEIHPIVRSKHSAYLAVQRALSLAKRFRHKVYVCHATTRHELEIIQKAKLAYCEVTPHHLFLDESEIRSLGNYSKVNPPLRSKHDRKGLWEGIRQGLVDTIATDHAPHTREEKEKGYGDAPAGVPGIETMLPLLLDAYNRGLITLDRISHLVSENPARIFGVENKGAIVAGYDADLVVVDTKKRKIVKSDSLFTKCGWSPFEGMELQGWPTKTFVNGELAFDDDHTIRTKGKEVRIKR